MGLMLGTAKYFYGLCLKFQMGGGLLNLGHQRILVTPSQAANETGLPEFNYFDPTNQEYHLRWKKNYISSAAFFKACGFRSVDVLDVSRYENANVILDLNATETPEHLIGAYDTIFDGSTIEHIFSPLQSLMHLVKMTKLGGCIIHMSPTNNLPLDGFYQFSPNFFQEFYPANGFETLSFEFHQFSVIGDSKTKETGHIDGVFDSVDTFLSDNSTGEPAQYVSAPFQYNNRLPTQIFAVFRKISSVDKFTIPFQRRYSSAEYWQVGL